MLMNRILDYLNSLNVAFVDRFIPIYISSAMLHVFNLHNKENIIYTEHGSPKDMRLHITFVAPSGFFKSMLLRLLLRGSTSVFYDEIPSGWESTMTEAGFVGSIRSEDSETIVKKGAAWEYRNSIMGVEEFSAIQNIMSQQHSLNLDNALLAALDEGNLTKRLSAGKIEYETNLTLWCASQPLRFNLTSGLGRRFAFIYFIPNKREMNTIKLQRRLGRNVRPNIQKLRVMREEIRGIKDKISNIEEVKINIDKLLDKLNVIHYEETLYERIALGYVLATGDFDNIVDVKPTPGIEKLLRQELLWRKKIKWGADRQQVISILVENPIITRTELVSRLIDFGMSSDSANSLVRSMVGKDIVEYKQKLGNTTRKLYKLIK